MFALDLFNTDHERRLAEGAVDKLEQRRIDDLAMKMDDLVARAKKADTPEAKAALVKEFQKCKAERDSYFKIKDECMGYGGLGETVTQQDLADIEAQDREHEIGNDYDEVQEAEKNQDIADKEWLKKLGREPQGPLDKSIETAKQAARWVAGKGGPGKEGPTYESFQKKNLTSKRINLTESRTYKLWESAGQKIVEYKLTPDQIQQLFQQVEQGATAAGGNRTVVGQGKDVASAVGQAWNDLLGKVQNSGPIKNVDAAYDQVAAKLKQATGGDAGVMKYVEKYRAFAKKHPIAQSLIYAALIGALSISSAGAGGVAALGLLKMTDRLLQGDKFSSAVGKGAVAAATAYGAHQLMQYFMKPDVPLPPKTEVQMPDGTDYVVQKGDTLSQIAQKNGISVDDLMKANSGQSVDMSPDGWNNTYKDAFSNQNAAGDYYGPGTDSANMVTRANITNADDIKAGQSLFVPNSAGPTPTYQGGVGTAADTWNKVQSGTYTPSQISTNQAIKYGLTGATDSATNAGQAATNAASSAAKGGYDAVQNAATQAAINAQTNPAWNNEIGQRVAGAGDLAGAQSPKGQFPTGLNPRAKIGMRESVVDRDLTVYTWALNESIGLPRGGVQLTNEGIGSMFKSAANKVGQWAQKTGHNLTTRVTADKLQKAWQKAGSPTDSDEIAAILQTAGVTPEIVNQIYASMRIPAPKQAGAQQSAPAADAAQTAPGQAGAEQPAQAAKKHTGGRVAGAGPSQTPNAVRQRQARAAQKNATTSATPTGANVFGQMANTLKTYAPPETTSTGGTLTQTTTGQVHKANPNNPNMAPAAKATAPATTAPAVRPNYGAQTGAGAKVTYNQPTDVRYPNTNAMQPTTGPRTPKVTTPATTAPGQPITVGGQKIKPTDPLYNKLANAPIKEPASAVAETAGQRLHQGDPVVVTAPNEFEGATGEIYEFSPSGKFVIVNLYNHGKHSMHLSDVEYNKYADDEDDGNVNDIDDGPQHAYDSDERTRSDQFEGSMSELDAQRQDLELMTDRQFMSAYGMSKQAFEQKYRTLLKPALDEKKLGQNRPKLGSARDVGRSVKKFRAQRGLDEQGVDENHATFYRIGKTKPRFTYGAEAEHGLYGRVQVGRTEDDGRVQIHYQRNGKNYSHPVDPDTLNRAGDEVEEGFQDFNKVEPYEVCLAGKCVKTFDYYEDARRFHDNWKKKLYREGDKAKADKITLNPILKELDANTLKSYAEKRGAQVAAMKADNPDAPAGSPEWIKRAVPSMAVARAKQKIARKERQQGVAEAVPTIQGTAKSQPGADYTGEDLVRDANALFTAGGFKLADKEVEPRDIDDPKKINTTYYWRKKIKGLTPDQGQVQQLMIEIYNYAPKRTYWAINDWANDGARVTPDLAQKLWRRMEKTIKDSIDTAERENYWYSMTGNGKKPKGLEEDTGSWIVYDPETKQIKRRFKTHTAGKSYARTHNLGFASSEFYFDQVKDKKEVAEAPTDYQKRRQRERDVDAGRPVKPLPKSPQTDYARKRAKEKRDMELGEDLDNSGVERAILNRIMVAHTDLLKQFGPEKVMQAAEEVADNVGDVDEIGTSDVSAYVNQVKQILGVPKKLDEKWSQKYKSSINCANPKGFSQRAHCAGKKK